MKSNIKEVYKRIIEKVNNYRWRERKVTRGDDNPNLTFYVIRRNAARAGLFSYISTNLGAIKDSVEKGYIPVIDMMSTPNPMITSREVGHVNAWDLFFEQPCGYSLEDIAHSRNIILSSNELPKDYPGHQILSNPEDITTWKELMHKYVKLKPEINQGCDDYINKTFSSQKVLGVLCRGTDYTVSKPSLHPIQPEPEDVIRDAKELMKKYDLQLIYLATEDENIWNMFNEAFPGIIVSYQKKHFSTTSGENINDIANENSSPYIRNREYLTSIAILSKCNVLLAGATGGSIGALLMSDHYEFYHIYQLGTYT